MALTHLAVDGLRCLQQTELTLAPGLNLIHGGNGAGKTSMLEAAYLLGRARSFRTRVGERLIRHGAERLWVFGRNDAVPEAQGGLEIDRKQGSRGRLNGEPLSSYAPLAEAFPVQVIDPEIHKLLEEGSARRRRWLDWAVFHVEHSFSSHWSDYNRALRQRNAALQQGVEGGFWDPELARLGEALTESRERFAAALLPHWHATEPALLGLGVELGFARGWPQDLSLSDALAAADPRDRERGTTTVGAHRADLQLRLGRHAARDILSRGQQKLAAVALTLAQLRCLQELVGLRPTLLLDDPAAELDAKHLGVFIDLVSELRLQRLVTSLAADFRAFGEPERVFHVEQGLVKPL